MGDMNISPIDVPAEDTPTVEELLNRHADMLFGWNCIDARHTVPLQGSLQKTEKSYGKGGLSPVATGLSLLMKAPEPARSRIVLWNTVYLERATNAVASHDPEFDDALLQYLSPLGWEHINLTGDYTWRNNAKLGTCKFRRLRPAKRP